MKTTNVIVLEAKDLDLLKQATAAMSAVLAALDDRVGVTLPASGNERPPRRVARSAKPKRKIRKAKRDAEGYSTSPAAIAARARRAARKAPVVATPPEPASGKAYPTTIGEAPPSDEIAATAAS